MTASIAGLGWVDGRAADEKKRPTLPLPEFQLRKPLPSVVTAAAAAGVPLDGIGASLERTMLVDGDTVAALVSLIDGAELKQWLIAVEAVAPTEKERAARNQPVVFFSSTGHELRFSSERAAFALRTIGPLTAADVGRKAATAPEAKRARATVDADFLGLGLNRPPAMDARLRKARAANPNLPHGSLEIGPKPFPPEVVMRERPGVEAAGITEADERSIIGSVLSLVQFFQIASRTAGLQDVVMSVIDVPWWSIIRSGGKMPGLNIEMLPFPPPRPPEPWGLPSGTEVWCVAFMLRLNDKPAMICQLAVVEPRPPLLPSAGIIGLAAGRPNGKGPVLTLQIVATRTGKELTTNEH